jgi:hypothetical protein
MTETKPPPLPSGLKELPYVMPPIALGMTVVYRAADGSGPPETGIVYQVGSETIGLKLLTYGRATVVTKDVVRHRSDPKVPAQMAMNATTGTWDYTDRDKATYARLAALETEVTELRLSLEDLIPRLVDLESRPKK